MLMIAPLLAACANDNPEPAPFPSLELSGHVVDAADILESDFETGLASRLEKLEKDTGVQLVVATTPSLEGYDINDYSLKLANAWKLGGAERDDGILLLVAPNERRVRIEVGFGLEASVRDEEAKQILDEAVLPEFSDGKLDSGISNGVDRLIEEVTPVDMKEAA